MKRYVIGPEDRLDLALRKILSCQLERLKGQLPGIRRDADTEFVHQARVATRRMRSSLRLLREAAPKATDKFIENELKWLGGLLGEVRDLDVFLLNLQDFKGKIKRFSGRQWRFLEDWIGERRQDALLALIDEGLDSPRYKNFELRLGRFLNGPLPRHPRAPLAGKLVREEASALIKEKFDSVMEQGRAVLANPEIEQFHLLRVRIKRLRYACEFMASAYGGALDPFIERMVEIQDCLGVIQDTVFTRAFIDGLFKEWRSKTVSRSLPFVLGEIYQLQGEIAAERIRKFDKIWKRLASRETARRFREELERTSL